MLISNKFLIIWYDEKKDYYYYKISRQTYKKYQIGDYNQYMHRVVLMIPIYDIKKYFNERKIL